jgi:hypothetical protein
MDLISINIITNTGLLQNYMVSIDGINTYTDLLYYIMKTYLPSKLDRINIMLSEIYLKCFSEFNEEIFPLHLNKDYYQSILERNKNKMELKVIINEYIFDSPTDKANSEKFVNLFLEIKYFKEKIENDLKFHNFINNLAVYKRCFEYISVFEVKLNKLLSLKLVNEEAQENMVIIYNIDKYLQIIFIRFKNKK